MITILLIALALGVAGGLVMHKRQFSAGVPVLATCGVLAVVVALAGMLRGGSAPSLSGELEFTRYAAAFALGQHLAEPPAGDKALCVLNPVDAGIQALEDGLRAGLDGRIPVEFTLLDREAMGGPDATGLTTSMVAALLDQHPDADLVISMGDLPVRGQPLAALLRERGVRLAVARVLDRAALAPYGRAGVLAGAVIYRENPEDIGDLKDATPLEVFDAQFTLLRTGSR